MHVVDNAVALADRPARQVQAQQTPPVLQRSAVADNLLARVFAILQKFPGATELVFNRPGEVMVEHGATWEPVQDNTLTLDWVQGLAIAVGRFTNQQINASRPIMSAMLPGGERLQIVLPPAVEPGFASLSLRIPAPSIRSLEDYNSDGYFERFAWGFDEDQFARRRGEVGIVDAGLIDALQARDLMGFFSQAVGAKKNIAVVGDTGSGKTTLMKTLCQLIPPYERLVTIEDVRELFLPKHHNRVHLLYSKGGQGQAQVSPADLIASCMRMKPDRALLAELRGGEAFDFLKLLTTGHAGSITSFHAESCALAFERYVFMAKEHPDAGIFDSAVLRRLVSLTIDVIVHVVAVVVHDEDGKPRKDRFIKQIHFDPLGKLDAEIGRGATMHVKGGAA
jgi:type IV secretion system protein VirB11